MPTAERADRGFPVTLAPGALAWLLAPPEPWPAVDLSGIVSVDVADRGGLTEATVCYRVCKSVRRLLGPAADVLAEAVRERRWDDRLAERDCLLT